jgi:hypothetical protein
MDPITPTHVFLSLRLGSQLTLSHLPTFTQAGLPQPPQNLSGLSLMSVINDPSLETLPGRAHAFSQYPRTVRGESFMGMTMRTTR